MHVKESFTLVFSQSERWKRYRMYAWQCVHTVVADDTTTADRRVVGPSKTKSISF